MLQPPPVIFFEEWVCRYGLPKVVTVDQGPAFRAEFEACLKSTLNIQQMRATVRHPEGNAFAEVFHKSFKKNVISFDLSTRKLPFSTVVQLAALAYRVSPHLVLQDSPAFVTFGQDLRPVVDEDWRCCRSAEDEERLRILRDIRFQIYTKAVQMYEMGIKAEQPHRKDLRFKPNDLILLHLNQEDRQGAAAKDPGRSLKIVPSWGMPHRVLSVSSEGQTAFVECLISGRRKSVHISNVRFINRPLGEVQKREWMDLALKEANRSLKEDEAIRQQQIDRYWEPTNHTKELTSTKTGQKRRRIVTG